MRSGVPPTIQLVRQSSAGFSQVGLSWPNQDGNAELLLVLSLRVFVVLVFLTRNALGGINAVFNCKTLITLHQVNPL